MSSSLFTIYHKILRSLSGSFSLIATHVVLHLWCRRRRKKKVKVLTLGCGGGPMSLPTEITSAKHLYYSLGDGFFQVSLKDEALSATWMSRLHRVRDVRSCHSLLVEHVHVLVVHVQCTLNPPGRVKCWSRDSSAPRHSLPGLFH